MIFFLNQLLHWGLQNGDFSKSLFPCTFISWHSSVKERFPFTSLFHSLSLSPHGYFLSSKFYNPVFKQIPGSAMSASPALLKNVNFQTPPRPIHQNTVSWGWRGGGNSWHLCYYWHYSFDAQTVPNLPRRSPFRPRTVFGWYVLLVFENFLVWGNSHLIFSLLGCVRPVVNHFSKEPWPLSLGNGI